MNVIVPVFITANYAKGGKRMALKSAYMKEVYEKVCKRDQGEPEFLQAVGEVLESLVPVV